MDWKLVLLPVPVSDVDRAKAFYTQQVGFRADHDGSVQGVHLSVTDIEAARAELVGRGVQASEVEIRGRGLLVFCLLQGPGRQRLGPAVDRTGGDARPDPLIPG